MQAVGTITHALAGTVYHQPDRAADRLRNRQKKTDYGAQWCRNSFLKTKFPPVAPQVVTRNWNNEEYNYITKDNYNYLLESAMNYASLLGIELKHNQGNSIGEGISNIYDELDVIIGEINLNIETREDRLVFVLWKYHPWGDYTFYWLPVKFTESLSPALRKIAISFIHSFMHSNNLTTTNEAFDTEWVLEWAKDSISECDPDDRIRNLKLMDSYEFGKIHRLMRRIETRCYYKNLPAALKRYIPNNEFERRLIELFTEGLAFIGKDKPSIMSYGYDPLYDDEDRDYHPVDMERMIRIVYDNDDFVSEWMMDWANQELRESYDISPATCFPISPDTTEIFSMDKYPDHFFKWFDKLCTLIA
jgi:hypothetical protein